ncbi:MAG: ATP-dependent zinc protease [Ectothiorhodospira sp.]
MRLHLTTALLLVLMPPQAMADEPPKEEHILGWVEWARLMPDDVRIKAKLDTGATTSSLNALDQETFERDGEEWIAFDILDPEDEDRRIRLEREITRHVRIVRHSGDHQRRPVVEMELCLGGRRLREEVNLVDRTELTYQLLVGRNHMEDAILVDPGETFVGDTPCPSSSH